jgi:hypothetical protein
VEQAGAGGFALKAIDALHLATVRAERAVRPTQALEIRAGLNFVGEDRIVQIHGSTYRMQQI